MGLDIAALAGGFGFNLVNNAIQYYTQKNQQRQAQANTRKNMHLQQELEDESYERRMMNATRYLKANGLSPVLATGAPSPGAASVTHSEAMPQVSAHDSSSLVNSAMLNKSQEELNLAAAENARADAKLKEQDVKNKEQEITESGQRIAESQSRIELNTEQMTMLQDLSKKYQTEQLILGTEYSRMLTQDSVVHAALMDYCNRRIASASTESERDYWTGLQAIGRRGKFDSGAVMAMSLFSEAWNSLEEYEQQVGARAILNQLQKIQLGDNELLDTMAHMPAYQAALVFGQTAEAYQNAAFRRAYREDLLPSEREKLDEDIRVQKHNDPAGMLKDGDLVGFGVYGLGTVLRWIPQFYMARQFGKGSSLSDPRGKQPNGQPKTPSKGAPEAGKTFDGKTPPRIDTRSDTAVKQSVAVRLGQARADALYDEFLKSGYRSRFGDNSFSEWLAKVKHIGR